MLAEQAACKETTPESVYPGAEKRSSNMMKRAFAQVGKRRINDRVKAGEPGE